MLPVSGAEQLNASDASPEWPSSSAMGAYSRLERPKPFFDSGRNMFHRPAALALAFSSSITGGTHQRPPSSVCWA